MSPGCSFQVNELSSDIVRDKMDDPDETQGETKPCRGCMKSIAARASRCPYCQSFQSRWYIPFVVLVGFAPLLVFWPMLNRADFADHKDQISVQVETTKFDDDQLTVTGAISNSSKLTWESPIFEVTVWDVNNKRLDVVREEIYDMIVVPGEDNFFRFTESTVASSEETDRVTIRIRHANAPY